MSAAFFVPIRESYTFTQVDGEAVELEKKIDILKDKGPDNCEFKVRLVDPKSSEQVGYVEFSILRNVMTIDMIENSLKGRIKGIGTALFDAAMEKALLVNPSFDLVQLEAADSIGFHRKMGFEIKGEEELRVALRSISRQSDEECAASCRALHSRMSMRSSITPETIKSGEFEGMPLLDVGDDSPHMVLGEAGWKAFVARTVKTPERTDGGK